MDIFGSRSPKLELTPSEHIEFIIDKSKILIPATLTIKNQSDFSVAFKLKSSSQKDFQILPQESTIPANETCSIVISYKISMESLEKFHKFLLQTVAINDNEGADWRSAGVHEYKLFAKFIDIQYLPRPKVEPVVEIKEEIKEIPPEKKPKKNHIKIAAINLWNASVKRSFNFCHLVIAASVGATVTYLVIYYY